MRRFLLICLLAFGPALYGQTLDASHIVAVATVDGPWRMHAGDDARWADPSFDDSGWPLIRFGQTLADAHMSPIVDRSVWLRLRIENAPRSFGLALLPSNDRPYEVYANGARIAVSPGWASRATDLEAPFAIALPSGGPILLAIHIGYRIPVTFSRFPLTSVQVGPLASIVTATDLGRVRYFNEDGLAGLCESVITGILGLVAFFLFMVQRDRWEYLWLGLTCAATAAYIGSDLCLSLGVFPETHGLIFARILLGFSNLFFALGFVMIFSKVRPRLLLRLLSFCLLAGPGVFLILQPLYTYYLLLMVLFWIIGVSYCLIDAYRRGRGESGILLPCFAVSGFGNLFGFASRLLPHAILLPNGFKLGYVHFGLENLGTFLCLGGLFLVVFLRFVRVTREQQQSEAEFEAARTVQQVLIPEELPVIAGLAIESVYRPAQQVGGDFFQVIAAGSGKDWDGAALIVIGDVAGKGMQAAMTVSLLVGAVRMAAETIGSPGLLMAALNRRLHGRGSSFTTCLILHVAANGEVTAANAGHLLPYLGGREVEVEAGLPLGFDADAEYPESRFTLAPGERLTLVTDGVVEATNVRKELFGFARTASISANSAHAIAEEAQLFGEPGPQADDITVLTLVRA